MNRLSQSVLAASEECGRKAQYLVEHPVWAHRVGGSARAVGTGYHAGLEHHYAARRDGRPIPTTVECVDAAVDVFQRSLVTDLYDDTPIVEFRWDENVPDQNTAESHIRAMVSHYFDHGCEWPADWQVLDVESHVQLTDPRLGQVKFGADLILSAPDGGLVIEDHKTAGKTWGQGKSDPRKNVQAPFYQRLARQIWPDRPYYRFTFGVMLLPRPKAGIVFSRIVCDPQPVHEEAIVARALDFLFAYNVLVVEHGLDLPANPNSSLCSPKFCDFFSGCPHGAILEG